ncbi:SHPS1 phosphatase, partial [Chloroceryle aenea]|nr:SHPS1 phosphatase [Chloroceryle aenea]
GQSFRLQQPQNKVEVTAGETLTLTCITSGGGPLGPVRWLKGWGSENKTIYDQRGSFPRVTRVVGESNTDFSIRIRDVQPEDSGTYYCLKFSKNLHGIEELAHGESTVVSVRAKPSTPVVSGPDSRVGTRQPVPFTCTSRGFFPENISVKWFKDRAPISAQQPQITPEQMKSSYAMSSNVTLTLQKDDVRSQLICEVQHPTLAAPLRGTYQLGEVLRVSPRVRVVNDSRSSIKVNETVNFICLVEEFYPGDVEVAWLENGVVIKELNSSWLQEMPGGLFKLTSQLEVQATEEKNGSLFTCRVLHDGQKPISVDTTLWISVPAK